MPVLTEADLSPSVLPCFQDSGSVDPNEVLRSKISQSGFQGVLETPQRPFLQWPTEGLHFPVGLFKSRFLTFYFLNLVFFY
jgi:hypothetical protein